MLFYFFLLFTTVFAVNKTKTSIEIFQNYMGTNVFLFDFYDTQPGFDNFPARTTAYFYIQSTVYSYFYATNCGSGLYTQIAQGTNFPASFNPGTQYACIMLTTSATTGDAVITQMIN